MPGGEMREIAFRFLGGGADRLKRGAVLIRRHRIRQPAIGEAAGAPERRPLARAAPDRRAAGAMRSRQHLYLGKGVEFTVMLDRLGAPQFAHDLDGFAEAGAALLYRHAGEGEFAGKFAADADAEYDPPR